MILIAIWDRSTPDTPQPVHPASPAPQTDHPTTRVCVTREHNMRNKFLMAALSAAISLPAVGADTLPTIVISASRTEQPTITTPASITVIRRDEIEDRGHRHLAEVLAAQGGIQIRDLFGDGSNTTIDMRGFGPTAGSNTLVLVDGRRLNNSGDMATPELNSIDLQDIERIEIIQGSAGVLFGNQAVGGMINIITRSPNRFESRAQAEAGDYHSRHLSAQVADRIGNGLAYRLSARSLESDNYRDNNNSRRDDISLRLDFDLPAGGLFFEHQWHDEDIESPGSLFADELAADRRQSVAAYAGDYSETRTAVSRLGLKQALTAQWRFEGELTYRNNDRDFQASFRTFAGSRSTQEREVWGFNPRLIGTLPSPWGEVLITVGADIEETEYRLLTAFGPQNLDQHIHAAYAQAVIPYGERWSLTLGLRHARVENDIYTGASDHLDDEVSVGSLGLAFRPDAHWRLFARADENYRFATVDEHTNPVFGQPVGLDNQTGISYEAGAEHSAAGHRAKLVLYRLELEDEISFDAGGFSNVNLDRTRRRGAILEGEWKARPGLALGGSYSYTDPKITSGPFDGNRIPLVSRHSARLYADLQLAARWSLYAEALLASERVFGSDFANAFDRLPGYGLLNAALRYDQGPWLFSARVNNLLDKEYTASGDIGFDAFFVRREGHFPAPERNVWLSVRYQYD